MRTRPKRPARNLRAFVRGFNPLRFHKWPCLKCCGAGWRDCKHRCPTCGGTGASTRAACQKAYREVLEKYEEEKREYQRLVKARKTALKRLTEEQIQALRELGL